MEVVKHLLLIKKASCRIVWFYLHFLNVRRGVFIIICTYISGRLVKTFENCSNPGKWDWGAERFQEIDFYLILFIFSSTWKFSMNKNVKVKITDIWDPKHQYPSSEYLKLVSKYVFRISPGWFWYGVRVENHSPVYWPEMTGGDSTIIVQIYISGHECMVNYLIYFF